MRTPFPITRHSAASSRAAARILASEEGRHDAAQASAPSRAAHARRPDFDAVELPAAGSHVLHARAKEWVTASREFLERVCRSQQGQQQFRHGFRPARRLRWGCTLKAALAGHEHPCDPPRRRLGAERFQDVDHECADGWPRGRLGAHRGGSRSSVVEPGTHGSTTPEIENKFSLRASSTGSLFVDDVVVDAANLLSCSTTRPDPPMNLGRTGGLNCLSARGGP